MVPISQMQHPTESALETRTLLAGDAEGHTQEVATRAGMAAPNDKDWNSPAKKLPISKVHHSMHIMSMLGTASWMKEPQSRRQSLVQPAR